MAKQNEGFDDEDGLHLDTMFKRLEDIIKRDRGKHEEANQDLMALAMTLTVVLLGVLAAIGKHPRLGPDFTRNVRTMMDGLEDHLGKDGSTYSAFMSEFKTEMRHVREILDRIDKSRDRDTIPPGR